MILQKLQTLTEIEAILASELKRVRAERKVLETKQAKLNNWLELQSELLADPDIADSLSGGATPSHAPRLIEIESDFDDTTPVLPEFPPEQTEAEIQAAVADGCPPGQAKALVNASQALATAKRTLIKVVWESESSGHTVDDDGIERPFRLHKWDTFPSPISLKTSKNKWISSEWKTTQNNPHFGEIRGAHLTQFLSTCRELGFLLYPENREEGHRTFTVINYMKNGVHQGQENLGTISQDFDMWFSGDARFNPKRFAHIQDCLEDLRVRFEGRQAKADIGL